MNLWELPLAQGSLKSVWKLQILNLDTRPDSERYDTVYGYYGKLGDPGLPDPAPLCSVLVLFPAIE